MKLYDWNPAPNPRRVRIFLAEKGIDDVEIADVGAENATLREDYLAKDVHRTVPMLELDDGTHLFEAMAICRYLESLHPEPNLMGKDARESALVEMWERRAYEELLIPIAEIFRNTHPAFANRGTPGSPTPVRQVPELAERGKERLAWSFEKFDDQLSRHEFVAGDRFTVADITARCSIDFGRAVKVSIPENRTHLRRWYEALSQRPSIG